LQVSGFAAAGGTGGLRFGVSVGNAVAIITALESVTDITVLANPKILALNKQAGTVFIGTKLGYRDRTTIDASGLATIGEVKFLDTGTKLSFRPYIADDGYIRMDIYPKDSSGELDAEGIPTETTAELVTNIMVKDGQTIVIGGLFRDAITTTRSQVPLLGDIPLVGAAFRGTTDSNVRQEIIVLLTPHIITEPEQTEGAARADDVGRKRYGVRKTLQWIGRARLAEDRYTEAVEDYIDGDNKAALFKVNWALELRPTYLEAIRLKERIIGETAPDDVTMIKRIMLDVIEREEANKWLRR
jgi:type IV pilus assembly protein PilQ